MGSWFWADPDQLWDVSKPEPKLEPDLQKDARPQKDPDPRRGLRGAAEIAKSAQSVDIESQATDKTQRSSRKPLGNHHGGYSTAILDTD